MRDRRTDSARNHVVRYSVPSQQLTVQRATTAFDESLTWFQDAGDTGGSAYSLFFLGGLARDRGDHESAAALYRASVMRAREAGDTWVLAFGLFSEGNLAWLRGDHIRATLLYRESLELSGGIRARWPIAECLWGLTGLAAACGQPERAARLYGAERALRAAVGAVVLGDASAYDRELTAARIALGTGPFAAAEAAGRAMPLDRAIAYALADELPGEALTRDEGRPAQQPGTAARELLTPLTPREREVAALIAQGLSNRRIAEALVISKQTADQHVSNILGKLDLSSRTQVAAWVVEQEWQAMPSR